MSGVGVSTQLGDLNAATSIQMKVEIHLERGAASRHTRSARRSVGVLPCWCCGIPGSCAAVFLCCSKPCCSRAVLLKRRVARKAYMIKPKRSCCSPVPSAHSIESGIF